MVVAPVETPCLRTQAEESEARQRSPREVEAAFAVLRQICVPALLCLDDRDRAKIFFMPRQFDATMHDLHRVFDFFPMKRGAQDVVPVYHRIPRAAEPFDIEIP